MLNLPDFQKHKTLIYYCACAVLLNFALLGGGVYAVAKSATHANLVDHVDTNKVCGIYAQTMRIQSRHFIPRCQAMLHAISMELKPPLNRIALCGLLLMIVCGVLFILLVTVRFGNQSKSTTS